MRHPIWIWQQPDWPNFTWNNQLILPLLTATSKKQGELVGTLKALGFDMQLDTALENMTEDLVRSSEIEGVLLNENHVRSSIARNLGLPNEGMPSPDHYTEGIVNVLMDAIRKAQEPITSDDIFRWHAALFPLGRSGGYKITVAQWREGTEPMMIVSGALGKEKIHYIAPESKDVSQLMEELLNWVNTKDNTPDIIKSAIAHLWFVVIHPLDDGNGRIARTISDVLLSKSDGMPHRYYSMSAAILNRKKSYYEILEHTSMGSMDITEWLVWFLETLDHAISDSLSRIECTLKKSQFWQKHAENSFNDRQRKVINRMLDGIEGKMTTSKWAKMTHTSQPTAFRDIEDLINKRILSKAEEGGRSTNYILVDK